MLDALGRRSTASSVTQIPVPHPGNEQAVAVAADPPDQARLGDPVGLGRDEPGRAQDRARRSASRATRSSACGGRARRRTSIPAGDAAKGYIASAFNVVGHELPGDPGHQEARLRRGQGQPRGPDADRQRLLQPRRRATASSTVEAMRIAQEQVRQGHGDRRAGALGPREPEPRPKRGSRSSARPACSRRSRSTLRRPRRRRRGQVPAVGRQRVEAVSRLDQAGDRALVRKMVEESAAKYAKEKKITPRDCSKEG